LGQEISPGQVLLSRQPRSGRPPSQSRGTLAARRWSKARVWVIPTKRAPARRLARGSIWAGARYGPGDLRFGRGKSVHPSWWSYSSVRALVPLATISSA